MFHKNQWLRFTVAYLPSLCLAVLPLSNVQAMDDQGSVADVAGIYSSSHQVTVNGLKETTYGYVVIDSDGHISAYEQQGESPTSIGSGCYQLASGTQTNAGLQSRTLTAGTTLQGDAAYLTDAANGDTFGILSTRGASGNWVWYFHNARQNNTVKILGTGNVVNSDYQSSYSISFPALAHPTQEELNDKLCSP